MTYMVDIYATASYVPLMKKTMMYLPEDLHRFLADEAGRRGVSMAEIAREALSEYRAQAEAAAAPATTAIIGVIDEAGSQTDDASRVDEALAEHYAPGGQWDREHGSAGSR